MSVTQVGSSDGIFPALRDWENPSEDLDVNPIEPDSSPQVQFREIDWQASSPAIRHQTSPELSPRSLSPCTKALFGREEFIGAYSNSEYESTALPMAQSDRPSSEITQVNAIGDSHGTLKGAHPLTHGGLPSSDSGYYSGSFTPQPRRNENFGQLRGATGFVQPGVAFPATWWSKENIGPQFQAGATYKEGYEFNDEYPLIGTELPTTPCNPSTEHSSGAPVTPPNARRSSTLSSGSSSGSLTPFEGVSVYPPPEACAGIKHTPSYHSPYQYGAEEFTLKRKRSVGDKAQHSAAKFFAADPADDVFAPGSGGHECFNLFPEYKTRSERPTKKARAGR